MDREVIAQKLKSLRHCLQRIETKCTVQDPLRGETFVTRKITRAVLGTVAAVSGDKAQTKVGGWVKTQNFQRSDNKLRDLNMLTQQGVRQRMQLTRSFLARKEREDEMLNSQFMLLRNELAAQAERQP